MADASKTNRIRSLIYERKKSFSTYDGSDRISSIYEAAEGAATGTPCLRTDFAYVGASTRVEKTREQEDVWSAAYDIP